MCSGYLSHESLLILNMCWRATVALGKIGLAVGLALIKVLKDKQSNVHEHAAEVLW